jgi:hypothetical protein
VYIRESVCCSRRQALPDLLNYVSVPTDIDATCLAAGAELVNMIKPPVAGGIVTVMPGRYVQYLQLFQY